MEDFKHTPDEILANIKAQEAKEGRGRLKVFFGMAPGVGKTYAMLEAARADLEKGTDVLAGIVETHGREDTRALLDGMPVLPRKAISYRGVDLEEFDLEEALRRHPQLILVDELAHTNAPGSRHAKRFQDVEELLAHGIDVYTTLNVQHLESRADTVASITGATVRETVPDSILTNADYIQLVDLTPAQLLTRLKEGKVYMPDRARAAAENFFKESNLAALRELALRMTAEWVDHELNFIRRDSGRRDIWKNGTRLMVAVGPSPFSTRLVRWTRRMAYALNAPWIALSVETSAQLPPDARARLDKNLELARSLGAEVIVMPGNDVAEALLRVAHLHNVSQIVVGKPRELPLFGFLHRTTLVDKLIRECGQIDVYVVPAEEASAQPAWRASRRSSVASGREWAAMLATMGGVTLLGLLLVPMLDYFAPAFFYLMAVVALAFFVRPMLVFLSALCGALLWDLLFIEPKYTMMIARTEDVMMCLSFFVIALTIGHLTSKLRDQERNERARVDRTSALFLFTRDVAAARNTEEMLDKAQEQIFRLMNSPVALIMPRGEPAYVRLRSYIGRYDANVKELGVADWCFKNRQCAGRFTQTLPGADGFYLPMVSGDRCLGVIGVMPGKDVLLSVADRNLLESMAAQLALSLERDELERLRSRTLVMEESEKLNRSLLDSVSHEFKTPLAVIEGVTERMARVCGDGESRRNETLQLCGEMGEAAHRLRWLVKNLLDVSRLESGNLQAKPDWCDWSDVVDGALQATKAARAGHPVDVRLPEDFPPFRADYTLMEQAVANLLLNACIHTPSGTRIAVQGSVDSVAGKIYLDVCDEGPGIAEEMKAHLFERFRSTRTGGCGLGLPIVKGFVEAQQGTVTLLPSDRGAHFRIAMPWNPHCEVPVD